MKVVGMNMEQKIPEESKKLTLRDLVEFAATLPRGTIININSSHN